MARFLVDTHALLWWLADDPALPEKARAHLADPENELLVSMASLWEVAIKKALGKLDAPEDLPAVIEANGFAWLPVGVDHAWAVRKLEGHHGDPFDRLLVAQSQVEGIPIVSGDAAFGAYGVERIWA